MKLSKWWILSSYFPLELLLLLICLDTCCVWYITTPSTRDSERVNIYYELLNAPTEKALKVNKAACLGEIVYEPFQKFNNLEWTQWSYDLIENIMEILLYILKHRMVWGTRGPYLKNGCCQEYFLCWLKKLRKTVIFNLKLKVNDFFAKRNFGCLKYINICQFSHTTYLPF